MHRTSRRLAVLLIVSLITMNTIESAASAQILERPGVVYQRQVELFGPGAEVTLALVSGKNLTGSIGAVSTEFFELVTARSEPPQRIAYTDVATLELRKVVFRGDDAASPDKARRILAGLGIGRRIQLKTSSQNFKGNIQRAEDHLELLLEGKATSVGVAYADMQELRPLQSHHRSSSSRKAKVIIGGIVVAYTVVLPALCSARRGCTP